MRIYNIHTTIKTDKYDGWKVPLLIETEHREYTQTIVTSEELDIDTSEINQNETDGFDGSDKSNWSKRLTNITSSKTVSFEDYEDVYIDDNPSRFHAMNNPLTPIKDPQTEKEKKGAAIILDTLRKLTPYVGRSIYVGKQGSYRYFMKPEIVGDGIRMNCTLSVSTKDL